MAEVGEPLLFCPEFETIGGLGNESETEMMIVIVGASFAGLACGLEVRRLYPQAEVAIYDREVQVGYVPTNFNRKLKGDLNDLSAERSALFEEAMAERLPLYLGYELLSCDPVARRLIFSHEGDQEEVIYDRLVLALGSHQDYCLVEPEAKPYLLSLKSLADSQLALEKLQQAQSVAVVGAGQLGLECLDAFSQAGYSCQLIEARNRPLAKQFDQAMTEDLLEAIEMRGVTTHFNQVVTRISWTAAEGLTLKTQSKTYQADLLLLATNVRPNSQLFEEVLDLQADGTVWVNPYLETSQPGIFAVGDLIQLPAASFGQVYRPMVGPAILTGRLAAQNLFGPQVALLQSVSQVTSDLFGHQLTSLGQTQQQASLWEPVLVAQQWTPDRSLGIKLVASQSTGALLGVQLKGYAPQDPLLTLLSLALETELPLASLLSHSIYHQASVPTSVALCLQALRDLWRQLKEVDQ